jgi:spermidine synthase
MHDGFSAVSAVPEKHSYDRSRRWVARKICIFRLPQTKITAVEINPEVVAAARGYFFLPDDDERLQVVTAEGGEYIAGHPDSAEVLMIDGFDGGCQSVSLCSQEFYDSTSRTLKANGIMVVNLLSRDKEFQNYLRRIQNSFAGNVLTMAAEARGNVIAFALKKNPGKLDWKGIRVRACKLEEMFALPFREYAKRLYSSTH